MSFSSLSLPLVVLLSLLVPHPVAVPDEGMWPYDNLPLKKLKEQYGFEPDQKWIDHVRMASLRFDNGGSGSFISGDGLVMTNHHVAREFISSVSSPENDYVKDGFLARTREEELKIENIELSQLVSMTDVTDRVVKAGEAAEGPAEAKKARDAELKKIAAEEKEKTGLACDGVTLYAGGQFWVYRYKKYNDVRLVWAPETQIAYFGGDYDNFTYPRFCMDVTFMRVYEDGKPLKTEHFFRWNPQGPKDQELILVSGNPGTTKRLLTMAQVEFERDINIPRILRIIEARLKQAEAQAAKSDAMRRKVEDQIFSLRNAEKAYGGQLRGLQREEIIARKQKEETALREHYKDDADVMAAFQSIEEGRAAFTKAIKDGDRRAIRRLQRDLEAKEAQATRVIALARFKLFGKDVYPDATFTLRLSFGKATGYELGTTKVPFKTSFWGLYDRNASFDGAKPFNLPERWEKARSTLDLNTPVNFVGTLDTTGGNSGSPVFNRNAEIVGLLFDGNIQSLICDFVYDEEIARSVMVHSAGMTETLRQVFGANHLLAELGVH